MNQPTLRGMVVTAILFGLAAAAIAQPAPPITIALLSPDADETTTTRQTLHVLAKVSPAGTRGVASIAGTTVPIYSTGTFTRDNIPLQLGQNSIDLTLTTTLNATAATSFTVTRVAPGEAALEPPTTGPLFIDPKSVEPGENLALAPGEELTVRFKGTPGAMADFAMSGTSWYPMEEVPGVTTGALTGIYSATIRVPVPVGQADPDVSHPLVLRLRSQEAGSTAPAPLIQQSKAHVAVWPQEGPVRLVQVKPDSVGQLAYGLTEVRLGGPYLAELTSGTILRVVGRRGYQLKVQLGSAQQAWISANQVEPVPAGTVPPHLEFTSLVVAQDEAGNDVISVPYSERVPFAVYDLPTQPPQLVVDFYDSHLASTWWTHRNEGRAINQVNLEQPAAGHVRLTARTYRNFLWGYKAEVTTGSLKITMRKPPGGHPLAEKPLEGLTIALEAGHGGSNSGAVGRAGVQEKDVTLSVTQVLEEELKAAGANVVQTRIGDESVGLGTRAARAMEANADLFVSIHCNSSGTDRGFLTTRGNAMFYKHPFNHTLATLIHDAIIEETGLPRFGVVGNFNYSPVRVLTWMPAVLVEQAFLSNPEEEALMAEPEFQKKMAVGIRKGLENYMTTGR